MPEAHDIGFGVKGRKSASPVLARSFSFAQKPKANSAAPGWTLRSTPTTGITHDPVSANERLCGIWRHAGTVVARGRTRGGAPGQTSIAASTSAGISRRAGGDILHETTTNTMIDTSIEKQPTLNP